MSSPPSLVPIPVSLLSGRTAVIQLQPSDTVAELERQVEVELEVPCFHEAQLSLGLERLRPDLPVADLDEQLKGGAGHVKAVVAPSAPKALAAMEGFQAAYDSVSKREPYDDEYLARVSQRVSAMARQYAPALKILIEQSNVDADHVWNSFDWSRRHKALCAFIGMSRECESCRQFATMFLIFMLTRVHDGCRRLKYSALQAFDGRRVNGFMCHFGHWQHETVRMLFQREEFDRFIIPAISNMEWRSGELFLSFLDPLDDPVDLKSALEWLAERHPRAAVRAAASEKISTHPTSAAEAARRAAPARAALAAARSAGAAAASTELEANELAEAVSASDQEALQQEGQQVIEAVMRSKADRWNADGVVLARLTCYRPEIMEFLRNSECLSACRARVADAGCEQSPAWAGGALLLIPATREQISEAGIGLRPHHVLMLSHDKGPVQQALSGLPRRVRPKLMPEHHPEGQGAPPREPGGARGTPRGAEAAGQGSSPTTAQPASYAGAPEHGKHGAPEIGRMGECGINAEHPEVQGAPPRESGGAHGAPRGAGAAGQDSSPSTAQPASYAGAPAHELGKRGAQEIGRWMEECGIEVERTFLNFPLVKDVTEASEFTESAPAWPGEPSSGGNPRRWRALSGKPWPRD